MPAMKPKVREELAVVQLDGEAVVYDEAAQELHHLNPTATIVFTLCDGTSTVKQMAGEIAEAFGVETGEVERQIRTLVREFRRAGLLTGSPMRARNGG